MPESLPITPYVPQYITVHLGPPGSDAENVVDRVIGKLVSCQDV